MPGQAPYPIPQMSSPNPFGMSQNGKSFGSIPMAGAPPFGGGGPQATRQSINYGSRSSSVPAGSYPMAGGGDGALMGGGFNSDGTPNRANMSYPMSGGQVKARAASNTAPGYQYPMSNQQSPNGAPTADGSAPMAPSFSQKYQASPAVQASSPFAPRAQISMANSTQQAADNIRANPIAGQTPNQPMHMSEDAARQSYSALKQLYPGQNVDQQFVDHMHSQYGQDGAAMRKIWARQGTLGQPVANRQDGGAGQPADLGSYNSQGQLQGGGAPISKYGTFADGQPHFVRMPSGDTILVKANGEQVGGPISRGASMAAPASPWGPGVPPTPGSPDVPLMPMSSMARSSSSPMMSQGNTNQPSQSMAPMMSAGKTPAAPANFAPGMASSAQGVPWSVRPPGSTGTPPGWTDAQTQEVTHERLAQADRLDNDAAARRATLPISDRERFDADNQTAQTLANAVNQPRVNYNVRTGGATPPNTPNAKPGPTTKPSGPPQIRPADRVAAFKATENLRVVDQQTGKTRKLSTDERQHEVDRMLNVQPPTTQTTPQPGNTGQLRSIPKSLADRYWLSAGGDHDAFKNNMRADGYDPDQIITGQ